ncbi:olfactory receptor 4C15-like [Lampris incognitus]|uniref:olfactory receptor 4C15-like n=1 Tax=Lampris incognitus TaxID=2546036 RepID=UPI0024B52B56|nr:olfactory receptor 4C15-like [Lampris incognitus]
MGTPCNVTALEAQTQMDTSIFHLIKLVSSTVSCTLNTLLNVPLLLAITRSPSLLRHTRFLLLTHLLCCDNLRLLLCTVQAVLLIIKESMPVAHCLVFCAATQFCSLVDLFLSTALALDRCVAIKWPFHYEICTCVRRKTATVAVIWTLSCVLSSVALCIGLKTVEVNGSLPRCRPVILAPCVSDTSVLFISYTVGSGVVLPVCHLTIMGCFFLVCWDIRGGLLFTKRARVTLTLQAAQTVFYSVPLIMDSYLIPGYLHCDGLDIAASTTYSLGVSLIPLVYGYRSRELQQRMLHAAHGNRVNNAS